MKNLILIITIVIALSSCEKTVDLDLYQATPRIIIEGLVTNKANNHYIKVSRSNGFYDTGETPKVENALVVVTDSNGNEYPFVHNPENVADSAGYYLPVTPFAGTIGTTYTLRVTIDGDIYEGSDLLNPVTKIDSLGSRISEDEKEEPEDFGRFYEVLLYAKEPQATTDYYFFKFYRNDSLKLYDDTDIYFADDEVLGEDIEGVPSAIYYKPGDLARVEMYSLSRNAFVFYSDLQSLLSSDGGLFSQPPSNSRSNLSNGALGFFQASAMEVREMVVPE